MEPEPPTDEAATAVPDPRDRRRAPRRSGDDRRNGSPAPADMERRQGDRRETDRRQTPAPEHYRAGARHINEYPLLPEEMEFINAINAYKQRHQRPFPTWSEVLHVLKGLGYEKHDAAGAPPRSASQ